MSDINHRYRDDQHGPLTPLDFAELFEEVGYRNLTPALFPDVVATIVARVKAAQGREALAWADRAARQHRLIDAAAVASAYDDQDPF